MGRPNVTVTPRMPLYIQDRCNHIVRSPFECHPHFLSPSAALSQSTIMKMALNPEISELSLLYFYLSYSCKLGYLSVLVNEISKRPCLPRCQVSPLRFGNHVFQPVKNEYINPKIRIQMMRNPGRAQTSKGRSFIVLAPHQPPPPAQRTQIGQPTHKHRL